MVGQADESDENFVKGILSKHWKIAIIEVVGGIIIFICCIFVALWFLDYSGYGSKELSKWSMGGIFDFVIRLILWEVLFVGIPAFAFTLVVGLHWWKRLPDEEREEIMNRFKRKETQRNIFYAICVSLFPFLVFLAFCVIIYLDRNWDEALGSLQFGYIVYNWLWALIWVVIIFGIPMGVAFLLWLRRGMKKTP